MEIKVSIETVGDGIKASVRGGGDINQTIGVITSLITTAHKLREQVCAQMDTEHEKELFDAMIFFALVGDNDKLPEDANDFLSLVKKLNLSVN